MKTGFMGVLPVFVAFCLMGVVWSPSALGEESEPAYSIESGSVHFHGVEYIMPQTTVPVSVTVTKFSEVNSSHMIAVHFQGDGDRSSSYIPSLDSTDELEVTGEVLISSTTENIDIELEVLICKDDPCDMNKSVEDRFENEPHSSQSLVIESNFPKVVRMQGMQKLPAQTPRFTFEFDESNAQSAGGHWRLTVSSSQETLPIQGMNLCINWLDNNDEHVQEIWNLADSTVYGFNPTNSESRVTFHDAVTEDGYGQAVAVFGTGDTTYIRSQDDNGDTLHHFGMSLVYNYSSVSSGAIFQSWGDGCSYDWDNDGAVSDAFPFDSSEQVDADMDGVGDNSDAFPNDPAETVDSDGDGVGDNADLYPNDATKSTDAQEEPISEPREDSAGALPHPGAVATLSLVLMAALSRRRVD